MVFELIKWCWRTAWVFAVCCAAPAYASDDVLSQVEDHCIQPGQAHQKFLTTPRGWSRLEGIDAQKQFARAALTVATWAGVDRGKPDDDPDEFEDYVNEEVAGKLENYVEDYNEGNAAVFLHPGTQAILLVETDGRRWIHLDCVFWPAAEDDALQAELLDRWTVHIPRAKVSRYGSRHQIKFYIFVNDTPAELSAEVTRVPKKVGPIPVYLELTLMTP